MGLVYGRMSFAQASRISVGDQHTNCSPTKTKPDLRTPMSTAGRGGNRVSLRRRSSNESDDSDANQSPPSVRLTRQASRQLAHQRSAAQQAATLRRSARLSDGSGSVGASAAASPTTLRRSARIAGFRSIGHRVVNGSRGRTRATVRRHSPAGGVVRRSARLARIASGTGHQQGH